MFKNLEFKSFFIGLSIGIIIVLFVSLYYYIKIFFERRKFKKDINRKNDILANKMEVDQVGIKAVKDELEKLRKENENLRITINNLMSKPDKASMERLEVYTKAIDFLTLNSPGFAQAWQSAVVDAESEMAKVREGKISFIKKFINSSLTTKTSITADEEKKE